MSLSLIVLILFYLLTPMLLIYLGILFPFVRKVGAVLLSYLIGIILGNIGILPEGSEKIQEIITMITIPIALPMLLFSLDVKQWFKLAKKTVLSLFIGVFAVVFMIVVGFYLFRDKIDNIWQIAGMLVGIYTGGTPNLAAIKTALNVSQ
ncbi:MAG: DUF819 family protein, partial [Chlorobi bacterium]|nr:DUF819 family protein [Chlorobiota bacterium]